MMLESLFLQTAGFFGGGIGNLLAQWEQQGIFSYVLPFLILFALIFGILSQMQLFRDNKAINSIIALAVSLMALQFDFVPRFFSEIFPRLGVGIAVILVLLILVGLFMDPDEKGLMLTLVGIGVVVFIVVMVNTSGALGWTAGDWINNNWQGLIWVVIGVIVFIVVVATGNRKPSAKRPYVAYMHPDRIK
jgi:hypothetical protein